MLPRKGKKREHSTLCTYFLFQINSVLNIKSMEIKGDQLKVLDHVEQQFINSSLCTKLYEVDFITSSTSKVEAGYNNYKTCRKKYNLCAMVLYKQTNKSANNSHVI